MRIHHVLIWIATLAVSLWAMISSGYAAWSNHKELSRERSKLQLVQGYAETVESLPSHDSPTSAAAAPGLTLAERVTAVLARSGLSHRNMEELSPESSVESGSLETRQAALILAPITLPELGRFLATWINDEPAWTVTTIDMVPIQDSGVTAGSDLPIRAVLGIASIRVPTQEEAP